MSTILDYDKPPQIDAAIPETAEDKAKTQNARRAVTDFIPPEGKPLAGPGRTVVIAAIEVPEMMSAKTVDEIRAFVKSKGGTDFQTNIVIVTKNVEGYGSRIVVSAKEELHPLPETTENREVE